MCLFVITSTLISSRSPASHPLVRRNEKSGSFDDKNITNRCSGFELLLEEFEEAVARQLGRRVTPPGQLRPKFRAGTTFVADDFERTRGHMFPSQGANALATVGLVLDLDLDRCGACPGGDDCRGAGVSWRLRRSVVCVRATMPIRRVRLDRDRILWRCRRFGERCRACWLTPPEVYCKQKQ